MSVDRKLEFVDTNILIYAHDQSAGEKRRIAEELIRRLWDSGDGCLSVQILQEFFVAVTHKVTSPMPLEDAEETVRDLCFWRVDAPNAEDVLGAIDIQRRYQISFWDAMVLHSAARLGCDLIWSEDLSQDRMYDGVQVKNPFEHG